MATVAQTLNPATTKSGFDLSKQMEPIALLGVVPNMLVAHPDVAAKNVKDLVALAKSKPDGLTFGTSGAGTASHLAAELFNQKAGTKIVAVHYQGGSNQALTDLLAGRITLMFNVAATLAPHVKADKLNALAMAQPKRAGIMPDLPTMDEAGMPGFDVGIWIGLLAPAGTPAAIVDKLSKAANDALKTDPVIEGDVDTGHRHPRRHAEGVRRLHPRRYRQVDRAVGDDVREEIGLPVSDQRIVPLTD